MAAVLCIGAAHIDRKAHSAGPVVLGSSNPVSVRTGTGGVARNVAETLARLGLDVALLSRTGADADGAEVRDGLAAAGVDCGLTTVSPTRPTATYTALIDPKGELVVALADMAVYEELTPELLAGLLPRMAGFDAWFVDCNLPAESLGFLFGMRPGGVKLFVDPVSVAKAARLDGLLPGIDVLFANRDEASRLARVEIRAPLDLCVAAARLLGFGVADTVITRGADGAFVAGDGEWDFLPALPARVREVTGAGDALVAGTIYGLALGLPTAEAVQVGLACAALAVETPDTVYAGLSAEALVERSGLSGARA